MENMFERTNDGFAPTPEAVFKIEEGEKVYDDAFVVRKSRFGLYSSIGVDGRRWVTGLTEEAVVFGTRYNLKAEIDGTLWTDVTVIGSAVVGGKL